MIKKVLFLDTIHPLVKSALLDNGLQVLEDYQSEMEDVLERYPDVDGLFIRSRFSLNRDFLSRMKSLQFIVRYGAGLENIDVEFAENFGIKCIRVPEGNRDAVGEHALGMLLMLFNHLKRADLEIRKGIWKREENRGLEIQGKTIGIIGFGYMGSGFAEKLQGFNCKVIAYDKYKSGYSPSYVQEVSLEEIYEQADIVSLHVPLTKETDHFYNEHFFGRFKKSIFIINTARGPILDTPSLVAAMEKEIVKGACLDVLEYEKTSFENLFERDDLPKELAYLMKSDRVILSPHIAGWSDESYEKLGRFSVDKVLALL